MSKWRVAGINFDHFHMGDNLRYVYEHPDAEIVGICDSQAERMRQAIQNFELSPVQVFSDLDQCIERTQPHLVILCPSTAGRAEWVRRVAAHGVHVMIEKPFAASLSEADDMAAAMASTGKWLAINWPTAWSPTHRTTKRLVDEGRIGEVIQLHYYGGNRGPLWHGAAKIDKSAEQVAAEKPNSWFYRRDLGGGSLLDYLGYGTTLGTWFMNGRVPIEVTCTVDQPPGLEVDEHSVTVARYETGLSVLQTRWGTFTDPWTHQPQPKCGFVIVGTEGTIGCFDYQSTLRVQDRRHPEGYDVEVDRLPFELQNPIAYLLDRLQQDAPIEGPLSVQISRIGQQIVDTALQSAQQKRTLPLVH